MSKITSTQLHLGEAGTAGSSTAAEGQIWVKSDTPSSLYYTDDAGTDFKIGWTVTAEVATTSGNSVAVTGLPAGIRNIAVFLQDVSSNGTNEWALQVSTGTTFATSGYKAVSWDGDNADGRTTGLMLTYGVSAAETRDGVIRMSLADVANNTWVSGGLLNQGSSSSLMNGNSGTISLSGAIDGVRIICIGGSNTFDAGSINVMYQ